MKNISRQLIATIIIALFIIGAAGLAAADVILYPGHINGKFQVGSYNAFSGSISASGGGYTSSKSVNSNAYSLTVQGGDWDYNVNASIYLRPENGAYYPYTYMVFNPRSFPVAEGQTVINDYAFNPGIVRFKVNISGDPYNSWYARAYGQQNVSSPGERTYSNTYAHSNYSTDGVWDMPVVPNDNIRIRAYVRVDNKYYYFWWYSNDLRYEDINPGEILEIDLNIVHDSSTTPPNPPPTYEYGTVTGTVHLNLLEPDDFYRHYLYGYGGRNLYSNPGDYNITQRAGPVYTYRVRTLFNGNKNWLYWPYTNGDYQNDRVQVDPGETVVKDFYSDTGVLTGELKLSGTLENQDLNSYQLRVYGASNYYDPANGWVRQKTYGGETYITKNGSDPDISYSLNLTPGPWHPYRLSGSKSGYVNGYYNSYSFNIYDYSHYFNGTSYNYGQPTYIEAGNTVVQDREYCMGTVIIRFIDDAGGLLSSPSANGSGTQYNENNQRILQVSLSGSSNVQNALQPEVRLYGPTGNYTISNLRITAQDGSRISFPSFPIAFECGVEKERPSSGKPEIVIFNPPAYFITNGATVTVDGIAADDTGIADVTINGNSIAFTPTGNPDYEVSFSHELALSDGINTILTLAIDPEGNASKDKRSVLVDRWMPTVTITTPPDGQINPPGTTVPVNVVASDRGYGYSLKVYVDGSQSLLCDVDGPANDTAAETVTCSSSVVSTIDDKVLIAEVTDLAGNTASTSVTIKGNTPPTADAGANQNVECAGPDGASVTLDGSGSSDTDGDALTYTWTGTFGTLSGVSPAVNLPLGTHSVTLTVDDGNGGSDSDTVLITVADTTPPVTTATISGTEGNNGWYVSTVIVSLSATDACTGVSELDYTLNGSNQTVPGSTASISIGEGTNSLSFSAVDNAGNTETVHQLAVDVDLTAPVISITGVTDGEVYASCMVPQAQYNVTDALSGVDSSNDSLTPVSGEGLTVYTYSVTATDIAGNTASEQVTYEVADSRAGLVELVRRYVAEGKIRPQMENSLISQILKPRTLKAFINHVESQDGKKIDHDAAVALINAAMCLMQ